jgi:hypothetical protein
MRFATNVRPFTDAELLNRVKRLEGFKRTKGIPLLIVVRSLEDAFNDFDDKAYLYKGDDTFHSVTSCTSNPGSTALKYFLKWNPKGAALLKADEFYPNGLKYGQTRGMNCLRQNVPFWTYRDGNKNEKSEEYGTPEKGIYYTHYHGVDFKNNAAKVARKINGWSAGCMVGNAMDEYIEQIEYVKYFEVCDLAILKEWH